MKGEILTLLLLLALGWTSCSNEEAIPGTEGGEDVTLSVDFQSAESMETKADEDRTINERFIAAFKGEKCTGIAFADDKSTTLKVKAKTGSITFIAIANANTQLQSIISDFQVNSASLTRDKLKGLIVSSLASSEETMIKMTEETKDGIQLSDSTSNFHFRLFQLQAKVTFKVSVAEQKGVFTITSYKIDGINQQSNLVLSDTVNVTNKGFSAMTLNKNGENPTFVTYERKTDTSQSERLIMTVTGNLTLRGKTESKSYTMIIDPKLKTSGGKTEVTDGIVHGWEYTVEGKITVAGPSELIVDIKAKPWDECGVNVDYGDSDK